MNESDYQKVFDVTQKSLPKESWIFVEGLVGGIIFFILMYLFYQKVLKKNLSGAFIIFMIIWTGSWLCLGGIGFGNIYLDHSQCVDWVKSGDYSVVTGNVSEFAPMPYSGHKNESFTVNNVHFEYSDYDLTGCGFNNTSSHGGPIKEGLPVRISYRDRQILILEIKK